MKLSHFPNLLSTYDLGEFIRHVLPRNNMYRMDFRKNSVETVVRLDGGWVGRQMEPWRSEEEAMLL